MQVHGDIALLASSRTPPSLALCRLGRGGLQHLGCLPLAVPEGVPNGSTVRLRGLTVQAVQAVDGQPAAGGGGGGQLLVWALLTAAQLGAAAPFLSAALSSRIYGSSRQQLWLACYALPVEAAAAVPAAPSVRGAAAYSALPTAAAGSVLASSVGSAPRHAAEQQVATAWHEPEAEAEEVPAAATVPALVLPGIAAGAATAAVAAAAAAGSPAVPGSPAAAAPAAVQPLPASDVQQVAALEQPADAVAAVLELQRAVADMRQEMNARLDSLSAGLEQLLRTLRPAGAADSARAVQAEPAAAVESAGAAQAQLGAAEAAAEPGAMGTSGSEAAQLE